MSLAESAATCLVEKVRAGQKPERAAHGMRLTGLRPSDCDRAIQLAAQELGYPTTLIFLPLASERVQ